ncbi:unnamed protein product [Amoebophrya sp. A25]|nr:unnamed protein product [Amoebophrya sp. A25]|eukprot:GSA25T00023740001.1
MTAASSSSTHLSSDWGARLEVVQKVRKDSQRLRDRAESNFQEQLRLKDAEISDLVHQNKELSRRVKQLEEQLEDAMATGGGSGSSKHANATIQHQSTTSSSSTRKFGGGGATRILQKQNSGSRTIGHGGQQQQHQYQSQYSTAAGNHNDQHNNHQNYHHQQRSHLLLHHDDEEETRTGGAGVQSLSSYHHGVSHSTSSYEHRYPQPQFVRGNSPRRAGYHNSSSSTSTSTAAGGHHTTGSSAPTGPAQHQHGTTTATTSSTTVFAPPQRSQSPARRVEHQLVQEKLEVQKMQREKMDAERALRDQRQATADVKKEMTALRKALEAERREKLRYFSEVKKMKTNPNVKHLSSNQQGGQSHHQQHAGIGQHYQHGSGAGASSSSTAVGNERSSHSQLLHHGASSTSGTSAHGASSSGGGGGSHGVVHGKQVTPRNRSIEVMNSTSTSGGGGGAYAPGGATSSSMMRRNSGAGTSVGHAAMAASAAGLDPNSSYQQPHLADVLAAPSLTRFGARSPTTTTSQEGYPQQKRVLIRGKTARLPGRGGPGSLTNAYRRPESPARGTSPRFGHPTGVKNAASSGSAPVMSTYYATPNMNR